ncbi:MAG: VOC family protein [Candidatus Levyibacteriota bacterium]
MGKVNHFELPADDPKRARDFYETIFGWKMDVMEDMDYTLVTTGPTGQKGPEEPGFINGGIGKRSPEFDAPDIVIDVESIDETLKTIEQHGGKIIRKKMPVGEMGFTAYFEDTEGNKVGLWETNNGMA